MSEYFRSGAPGWPLLRHLHIVPSVSDEADLVASLTRPSRPIVISFLNQHALNLALKKPEFAHSLLSADLLLRDGVGIELCLRILGRASGRNMNGTDFIPRLAQAYRGRSVALFATSEPWTSSAAETLTRLGCNVVSVCDGFRPVEDYVARLEEFQPELVILGMGMPWQEAVAVKLAAAARTPTVILNGGAIADFLARRFVRAPSWIRRLRLEWTFRLLQEPRRLFRRYIVGAVLFVWQAFQLRRSFSLEHDGIEVDR